MDDARWLRRMMTGGITLVLVGILPLRSVAQSTPDGNAIDRIQDVTSWNQFPLDSISDAREPFFPIDSVPNRDPQSDWLSSLSVGARTWISWGQSDTNFRVGAINVGSDLRWHNLVGEAGEITASGLLFDRLVLSGTVGGGGIDGQFVDKDYALPNRQGLYSDTVSPSQNDSDFYFNVDIGWRLFENAYFLVDGFIGYQYWREGYVADGGTFVVPPTAGELLPGRGLTEQYTWQGFRIGVQSVVQVSDRFALKSQIAVMPMTWFENDDDHLLRQLTATERAAGGFAVMYDCRVTYWIWRGLFAEVGYRIWYAQSGSGELTERNTNGTLFPNGSPVTQLPFNQGTTLRQGVTFGLTYQF